MTGTAELVASEVQTALEGAGFTADVTLMDGLGPDVFPRAEANRDDEAVFLICTSTYGNGDVPDNAQGLFEALETERPDLSAVRYGLIALGDRTYKATFAQGGLRFDALLAGLGARRIGDALLHDASSGTLPEDVAAEWSVGWAEGIAGNPEVAA
jgi:MioC protein